MGLKAITPLWIFPYQSSWLDLVTALDEQRRWHTRKRTSPGAGTGGWKGEPEGLLHPRKVWEAIQPGFTTTADLEAAFDAGVVKEVSKDGNEPKTGVGRLVAGAGGVCEVRGLGGAIIR
ncbi:hypothetical protein B0J14DRAFT_678715 [Halenospora varia]|nr:hypothetical protein B0J14DRAFT_678715 [Halenospora varia]